MVAVDMYGWFLSKLARRGRLAAGKTQVEIADLVDRHAETISAWELGKTGIPAGSIIPLGKACGMNEEITGYMRQVARARKQGEAIEADTRLNALFLSLGEEYQGDIFKFESVLFPGLLQTKDYHFTVVRKTEIETADQWFADGWDFKTERREAVEARLDNPTMQFLIGEAAFLYLQKEPEVLQREQIDFLLACSERPGWEIRVLIDPYPSKQGIFSIYEPGDSPTAGPPFVYTEVYDSSWCISDPERIAVYDEFRRTRWKTAIGFEEYLDVYRRDRVA